jgi:hypothetical protein
VTRADEAQPGDHTYYGTTVQSVTPTPHGQTVLETTDVNGQQLSEIWRNDDVIDQNPYA